MIIEINKHTEDSLLPSFSWEKRFYCDEKSLKKGEGPNNTHLLYIYTDGSKIDDKVGAGVAMFKGRSLEGSNSYRLKANTTVFQAEVYAILKAAHILKELDISYEVIEIYCDSQAAIKAISNNKIKTKLVKECVDLLNEVSQTNHIKLKWIKAHVGHVGNEHADKCAKEGALEQTDPIDIPTPKSHIKSLIHGSMIKKWNEEWNKRKDCRQTKHWFPKVNKTRSKDIIKLNRHNLSHAVQVITGHNRLNRHKHLIGDTDEEMCRLCEEDEESSLHIIAECPALANIRLQNFGEPFLKLPLIWSHQMASFIKCSTIGFLLDHDDAEIEDQPSGEGPQGSQATIGGEE